MVYWLKEEWARGLTLARSCASERGPCRTSVEEVRRMTHRLGVLGLGTMGLPLAHRLCRDFDIAAFDIAADRSALAAAAGIAVAGSAGELASEVDVLITVLPGRAAQEAALLPRGAHGPLAELRPGSVVLELTSGAPEQSRRLAAVAAARGAGFVSAPMAGDPARAANGTLAFFVAGAGAHIAAVRPVLDALSQPGGVSVVGDDPGAAQTAKLVVNALWFGQAALVGEMMLLAARSGLEPSLMQPLLAAGAADSAFVRDYLPRAMTGDYVDSFGLDGVVEELDTVVEAARMLRTPAELVERTRDLHVQARDRFGAVAGELLAIKLLEERAGMRLSDPPGARG
jgi:3-hydroxyisobutyrate dehydrogenase-like beta-hydroxyacid dehydrogenase